eukprot:12980091-Alexandrium_andersonii.AAC.1
MENDVSDSMSQRVYFYRRGVSVGPASLSKRNVGARLRDDVAKFCWACVCGVGGRGQRAKRRSHCRGGACASSRKAEQALKGAVAVSSVLN